MPGYDLSPLFVVAVIGAPVLLALVFGRGARDE
jgi:hypothetical protein